MTNEDPLFEKLISENETPIYTSLNDNGAALAQHAADDPGWFAKTRKAAVGAVAGAATAIVGTLPTQLGDGVFTVAEFWFTFTVTVGAAVVGFAAVWATPNAE